MEKTQYQAKLDFLNSYRWWKNEAKILRERIDNLEDRITAIRSQEFSDMPRGGTPVGTDELIAKKLDLLAMYKQDLAQAEDAVKAIYECIRSVDSIRDRTILGMNYVDGMSYARIGEMLSYSKKQIQRFNNEAVKNMHIPQCCPPMSTDVPSTV